MYIYINIEGRQRRYYAVKGNQGDVEESGSNLST